MKKLLLVLCLFPLFSFSQTLNVIWNDIDSFRSHLPVISSILGVQLNENKRQDETYPVLFGDKESWNYIQVDFKNRDLTAGKELVSNISINGASDKIDSLYNYFKSLGKKYASYTETNFAAWWENTRLLPFEITKKIKRLRITSRKM